VSRNEIIGEMLVRVFNYGFNRLRQKTYREKRYGAGCKPAPAKNCGEKTAVFLETTLFN